MGRRSAEAFGPETHFTDRRKGAAMIEFTEEDREFLRESASLIEEAVDDGAIRLNALIFLRELAERPAGDAGPPEDEHQWVRLDRHLDLVAEFRAKVEAREVELAAARDQVARQRERANAAEADSPPAGDAGETEELAAIHKLVGGLHIQTPLQAVRDLVDKREAALKQYNEAAGDAEGKRYGSIEEIKRDFFPTLHAEEMAAAKARRDAEPDELPDALAVVEAACLEARDERDEALAKLKAAGDVEGKDAGLREAVEAGRILGSHTQRSDSTTPSEIRTVAEAKASIQRAASVLAALADSTEGGHCG